MLITYNKKKDERFLLSMLDDFKNSQQNDDELINSPFVMPIDAIFVIKGRGLIIIGQVQSGTLRKGDSILLTGGSKPDVTTTVTAFEMFIKDHDTWVAMPGDNTAILLRELDKEQVEIGMIVTSAKDDSA